MTERVNAKDRMRIYCEEWPRLRGRPTRSRPEVPLCREAPDVPSLSRCPVCGGRVVRSSHRQVIRLWLDDQRPAPDGWELARTADQAKLLMLTCAVSHASLDHDLDLCEKCRDLTTEEEIDPRLCAADCACPCHMTGYDLVKWMEETGTWPANKPHVHSENPPGKANMRAAIDAEERRRGGRW